MDKHRSCNSRRRSSTIRSSGTSGIGSRGRTTYRLEFATDDVVREAIERIDALPPPKEIRFQFTGSEVAIGADGVVATDRRDRGTIAVEGDRRLPDVVGELSRRVPLSRATIVRILEGIGNLDQVKVNPSVFIDQVGAAMNQALYDQVADGIVYSPDGERWEA